MLRTLLVGILIVGIGIVSWQWNAQSVVKGQDDAATAKDDAQKESSADGVEDPYAVPEGTDSKTLKLFLERLMTVEPEEQTQEGILTFLKKLDGALSEILSRKVDVEIFRTSAEFRHEVLLLESRFEQEGADEELAEFVKQLKQDTRPEIHLLGTRYGWQMRLNELPLLDAAGRKKFIDDLVQALDSSKDKSVAETKLLIAVSAQMAQTLEQFDVDTAAEAYRRFTDQFEKLTTQLQGASEADLKGLNRIIDDMKSTSRRLNLLGDSMQISGTTYSGEKFDLKQYEGKVVLVDFWATWCGPCVAELPNVQQLYKAYHDKGFEVVGISLDQKRTDLERFFEDHELPWVTLFETPPADDSQGWDNPIARYYGVNALPTVILINQEGKVVNLNARGEILKEELAKLLGPVDLPEEPVQEESDAS